MNSVDCEPDKIVYKLLEYITDGMNVILWNISLYVLGQEIKYYLLWITIKVTALTQPAQLCLRASACTLVPRSSPGRSS